MKHTSIIRSLAAFAAAAFLFSCSTGSDLTIEKRRYRDGYYVAKHHKKDHKAEVAVKAVNTETLPSRNTTAIEQSAVQPAAVTEVTQAAPVAPVAAQAKATVAKPSVTSAPAVVNAITKKEVRQATKAVVKKAKQQPAADDVPDVVIILLCIFIPPLAVFLIKGGIDNDFWINLVLTFLCGIPGIIHAFIVYSRNK